MLWYEAKFWLCPQNAEFDKAESENYKGKKCALDNTKDEMNRVLSCLMKENKQWLCTWVIELEARLQLQNSLYAQEMQKMVEMEQELTQIRLEQRK